jgi:transcriptional regulator with XRE-family HTH domain
LKFLRRRAGLTQGSFSEIIGISRNSIASYENGLVEPNAFNFLRVCKYFDQDPKVMLEENQALSDTEDFKSEAAKKQYVSSSLHEFSTQTDEMSKVLEGYQEFHTMRKEAVIGETSKDFLRILDDLLALLSSLIAENQKLIESILPENLEV